MSSSRWARVLPRRWSAATRCQYAASWAPMPREPVCTTSHSSPGAVASSSMKWLPPPRVPRDERRWPRSWKAGLHAYAASSSTPICVREWTEVPDGTLSWAARSSRWRSPSLSSSSRRAAYTPHPTSTPTTLGMTASVMLAVKPMTHPLPRCASGMMRIRACSKGGSVPSSATCSAAPTSMSCANILMSAMAVPFRSCAPRLLSGGASIEAHLREWKGRHGRYINLNRLRMPPGVPYTGRNHTREACHGERRRQAGG